MIDLTLRKELKETSYIRSAPSERNSAFKGHSNVLFWGNDVDLKRK